MTELEDALFRIGEPDGAANSPAFAASEQNILGLKFAIVMTRTLDVAPGSTSGA